MTAEQSKKIEIVDVDSEVEMAAADAGDESDAGMDVEAAVVEAFELEIAEARRKTDENWDKFLRAEAELSNARKVAERARKEALARQRRDLVSRFLGISDTLDLAVAFKDADPDALLEGIAGIRREIASLFEREGVSRIEAEDADFDPHLHDAVGVVALPGIKAEKVIQVERAGYTMDGDLLRPARVIVGRPPEGDSD